MGELEYGTTRLDTYLILFMLQVPIFFLLRLVIYAFFACLTCCCNVWDEDLPEGLNLKERIISVDFVDYERGILNNFAHHVTGRREIAFNRDLQIVRAASIRARAEHAPANDPSQSMVKKAT